MHGSFSEQADLTSESFVAGNERGRESIAATDFRKERCFRKRLPTPAFRLVFSVQCSEMGKGAETPGCARIQAGIIANVHVLVGPKGGGFFGEGRRRLNFDGARP